jgi:hypothetical protein
MEKMTDLILKNTQREGFSVCPLCGRIIHAEDEVVLLDDSQSDGKFAIHEECEDGAD